VSVTWFAGADEREFASPVVVGDRFSSSFYRLLWPRTSFFTFFFCDPRGTVRFALGAAFLRAARLTFLRSSLLSIVFVFAIESLPPAWGGVSFGCVIAQE
jgi:hypothetical protein